MELRDGLIEFRETPVERGEGRKKRIHVVLEYRQCFKGIWTPWKPVREDAE